MTIARPSALAAAPRTQVRPNSQVREAAIARVRRASEQASRASLSKIEPSRQTQQPASSPMTVDREATARALEPDEEVRPRTSMTTQPLPPVAQSQTAELASALAPAHEPVRVEVTRPLIDKKRDEDLSADITLPCAVEPIDELEPTDYLEAELRKVNSEHADEFAHDECPSLIAHFFILAFDFLAIATACAPFLALIMILEGNFSKAETQLSAGLIILLISFFYLAITQCLTGKTFGMMLTNTRLVDAESFQSISPSQALVRTIGFFFALAPALIGLLWVVGNRKRRAWQDYLSGTLVTRDF